MRFLRCLACTISFFFLPLSVSADYLINFDDLSGQNAGSAIPVGYGSNDQFTVNLSALAGFGNSSVVGGMAYWGLGYGDLNNVAWGGGNSPTQVGQVRFDSLTSNLISLEQFDLADWDGAANNQTIRIYDGTYNLLFELSNLDVSDTTHNTIVAGVSAATVILQWNFPYNVAVDNIRVKTLTVTATPEPSSIALVSLCLGAIGWRARQARRSKLSPQGPAPAPNT